MKAKHIIIAVILTACVSFSVALSGTHISKYYQVKENVLYRSSQPDLAGFIFLKKQGIKSVVNFRDDRSDGKWFLRLLGFGNYLDLKVVDRYPPSKKQIRDFINFVTNPENQPVLMHCRSGKGRAGTFEVIYHHIVEGKTIDESLRETMLANKISDIQTQWLRTMPESDKFLRQTLFATPDAPNDSPEIL